MVSSPLRREAIDRAATSLERAFSTDPMFTWMFPDSGQRAQSLRVDPELQGRGLGTALVEEGLARAGQADCPCYLETSEARNLAYHECLGFVVVANAALGDGGPTGWGMRREPRGSRQQDPS
ncbi:MAG: GNAT family N-acetyltransferase [Dehalococcoidia bacterium]|nr:GNAT family N-acetyltransferase [Dehalococcoidia bacterium]